MKKEITGIVVSKKKDEEKNLWVYHIQDSATRGVTKHYLRRDQLDVGFIVTLEAKNGNLETLVISGVK